MQLASSAPNYSLDHITTKDGLPQSSVKAIAQDNDGFLWVGTELGLARYDGYRFKQFTPPFGHGIVTNIDVDSKGRIWVTWYNKPVTIFDPEKNSWQVLDFSQPASASNMLLEDSHGTIWLSDLANLSYYDELKKAVVTAADLEFNPAVGYRPEMALLNEVLWISVSDGAVGYNIVQRKVVARLHFELLDIHFPHGTHGLWIHDGSVWLCGQTEVFRIEGLAELHTVYRDQDKIILSCAHDQTGSLWVGTLGSGAIRIDSNGTPERFVHAPDNVNSIAGNSVNNIQQDSQGNLWLITYGTANLLRDGVAERFEYGPGIGEGFGGGFAAVNFFEDTSGTIWFGSEGAGLARISRYRNKFRYLAPPSDISTHVRKPVVDAEGNIWIGMQKDGVYRLNRDTGSWTRFMVDTDDARRLPTAETRAMLAAANNGIWAGSGKDIISRFEPGSADWTRYSLGGWQGVFNMLELPDGHIVVGRNQKLTSFDPATGNTLHYPLKARASTQTSKDRATIRATVLSKKGSVYVGTHEGPSVLEFVPGQGFVNSWSIGPADASVFSLYEDRFGYLWVGTWNEGLFRLDPATGETQVINMAAGLPDDTIFGILPDDDNNLWVSTYSGLARIEHCIVDSARCQPQITVFDASDGLAVTEFDSEAHLRAPNGELFFGGGEGLIYFDPDDIESNSVAPVVRLADAHLNNEVLQLTPGGEVVVLDNGYGTLSLQFSALDFHNPANNQYRYRLNPGSSWIFLGPTPNLTLSNLGMGPYTLQISGSNNDGVWSEQPLRLRLRVLPPAYLSNTAIAAYVLTLFLAIFLFVRAREKKLRTNKAMLESMVVRRTRELDDANMARDEFYANVSHEVRTPLTLLLNAVERLEKGAIDEQQRDTAQSIRRHSESLHRYIDSLITVSHLSSSPDIEWLAEDLPLFLRGLVSDISTVSGQTKIKLSESAYGDILVRSYPNALNAIFSNLLMNAVKHTPDGGEVDINVERSSGWITVTIADSGPGIDDDALDSVFDRGVRGSARNHNIVGFGIGLNLVKQTVKALGGQVSVRNNREHGACFEVRLVEADPSLPIASYEIQSDLGAIAGHQDHPISAESGICSRGSRSLLLIVEDHDELRSEICELLQNEYRVIQAADAKTAIDLAQKLLPDVVICDVMLPDKDGFEVLSEIKTNNITDHIAVMMLTALTDEESRISGLIHRADAYLTKPYRNEILKLTIRNLLAERRTMMRYSAMKVWQEETSGDKLTSSITESFERRFMAALQAVYADNESGVEEISRIVAMSRRQLERKTRSCFERSPNELLSEYRLNKATELLRQGHSVGDSAYRCGFGNQSHFATVFRRRFGMTPAAYKKQQADPDSR